MANPEYVTTSVESSSFSSARYRQKEPSSLSRQRDSKKVEPNVLYACYKCDGRLPGAFHPQSGMDDLKGLFLPSEKGHYAEKGIGSLALVLFCH